MIDETATDETVIDETSIDSGRITSVSAVAKAKPLYDRRKVETKHTTNDYDFLVIDAHEKWKDAKDFSGRYELDFGGKVLNIPLKGISYLAWEQQEEMYPYPEKPVDKDGDKPSKQQLDEYAALVENIRQQRKVFMFQDVVGKSIPGQSMDEKVAWLSNRGYDTVEAFYAYIELHMTGLSDGDLLQAYNMESAQENHRPPSIDLTSFEDWDTADKTHATFRMSRKFDDHIVEFNLRRVPHETKEKIDRETQVPDPPQKPGRNPITKKFDPAFFTQDTKDHRWLQACAAMRHKKTVMVLDATLPFDIPGNDFKEKYAWISKKLMGDVYKLERFVFEELLGYRRQLDFFTSN